MADSAWNAWRDRLASELSTLQESEFVIFDHVVPPEQQRWTQPKNLLLFKTRPRPQPLPTGYLAQFVGQGQDVVMGDLAGPTLVGGHIEITEAQDEEIRGLGWRGPGDPGHWEGYAPNYTLVDWPTSRAHDLAQITVDALEIQGARPDLQWQLKRDR